MKDASDDNNLYEGARCRYCREMIYRFNVGQWRHIHTQEAWCMVTLATPDNAEMIQSGQDPKER